MSKFWSLICFVIKLMLIFSTNQRRKESFSLLRVSCINLLNLHISVMLFVG